MAEVLSQVFSLLVSFLEPSLQTWIPVLIVFGLVVKKSFKLKGKFVPFTELGAGLLIALLNVLGKGMGVVEALGFIVGQGLLLAAFSMCLYDIGRAVMEIFKKKGLAENAETLEVSKEETN